METRAFMGAVSWALIAGLGSSFGILGIWSIGYLAFAIVALVACWGGDPHVRLVAIVLGASWTISNAWHIVLPDAPHTLTATLYTAIEIAVAVSALGVTLQRLCWIMIGVVSAAAFSASANVIYAITLNPAWDQTHLHQVSTNICFALECVFAVWAGWRHQGEHLGRHIEFRRAGDHRFDPQLDGAAFDQAQARSRK